MASKKGSVTVRGRFKPNSTVKLYLRRGDTFGPSVARRPVGSAKYTDSATFKGLDSGETYWAAQEVDGEWISASVTAKDAPEGKPKTGGTLDPGWVGQGLGKRQIVTGARSTVDAKAVREATALPALHEEQDSPEAAPRVGQDKGTVKQRSDTPLGEATPKDPSEVTPARSQEDTSAREKQRSNTEFGEAEPIPAPGDPVEQTRRLDSSEAKARGETPANPLEKSAGHKPAGEGGAKPPRKAAKKSSARKSTKKSARKSSAKKSK